MCVCIKVAREAFLRTFRLCDSCPARARVGKTQQLMLLLFLLGVVTVFGFEPLVNIKGGVPTERPCLYS